jgi:hypothetical protein
LGRRTERALQAQTGEVASDLLCDGQCLSEDGHHILDVTDVRKDPCRCFVEINQIPDPHSIGEPEEEKDPEEEFE